MIVRRMGEMWAPSHVPDRVSAPIRRSEPFVHHDPCAPVFYARNIEPEIINIRPAPGREQQMTAFDSFLAGSVGKDHLDFAARA